MLAKSSSLRSLPKVLGDEWSGSEVCTKLRSSRSQAAAKPSVGPEWSMSAVALLPKYSAVASIRRVPASSRSHVSIRLARSDFSAVPSEPSSIAAVISSKAARWTASTQSSTEFSSAGLDAPCPRRTELTGTEAMISSARSSNCARIRQQPRGQLLEQVPHRPDRQRCDRNAVSLLARETRSRLVVHVDLRHSRSTQGFCRSQPRHRFSLSKLGINENWSSGMTRLLYNYADVGNTPKVTCGLSFVLRTWGICPSRLPIPIDDRPAWYQTSMVTCPIDQTKTGPCPRSRRSREWLEQPKRLVSEVTNSWSTQSSNRRVSNVSS